MMTEATREWVRRRAGWRCEYCGIPQAGHVEQFSIDHVIARKHGGADDDANLALCCLRCNQHKGTDLTGIDPDSKAVVLLFDPRHSPWNEHFEWRGATIVGLTPTGRATVTLLQMNAPIRLRLRESLIAEGILRLD